MWLKQKLAWVLIVLMSINTFAAVVGDNDGAAFITKAEFESLKNDFQSQINRYNSSLDDKISGAISTYLAGVKVARTVKQKNLVDGYNDMWWQRDLWFYGPYWTWQRVETNPVMTAEDWYEPFFEQFYTMRDTMTTITGSEGRYGYSHMFALGGDWDYLNSSGPVYKNGSGDWHLPQTLNIKCYGDLEDGIPAISDTQPWYTRGTDIGRIGCLYILNTGSWSSDYVTWANIEGAEIGNWAQAPLLPTDSHVDDWLMDRGPTGRDVMNVLLTCNGINRGRYVRWVLRRSNLQMGNPDNNFGNALVANNRTSSSAMLKISTWSSPTLFSANGGKIHAHGINNETTAANLLRYMMLGSDNNDEVNIYRSLGTHAGSQETNDVGITYSNSFNMKLVLKNCLITSETRWTADDQGSGRTNYLGHYKTISLTHYLPERYKLAELRSARFKLDNKHIQIGGGLPLITSIYEIGNLKIDFDYEIKRTWKTVPSTATSIDVDVKKSNFLSGLDDFYKGSVNDGSDQIIKDINANKTTKHATILIPSSEVTTDNQVWLRVKPHDTDSGLYAKIKNLEVSLIIE